MRCPVFLVCFQLVQKDFQISDLKSRCLACTMIFDPDMWVEQSQHFPIKFLNAISENRSVLAASSAWLPLLYDTVVLGLTVARTIPSLKNRNTAYVMKRLLEDGLIYYRWVAAWSVEYRHWSLNSAIFAVTAVLTIMIIAAPPGLKNITAQLELL